MRLFFLLFILLGSEFTFAQAPEVFDFSATDQKKYFSGDTAYFTIENGELRSAGPATLKSISLSIPLDSATRNLEWNILTRLQFNPTAANYARIYLFSDQQDLSKPLNGYYLKLGGVSGNTDAVDLYKQNQKTHTKILAGKAGLSGKSVNKLRIRVFFTPDLVWKIQLDTLGGTNYSDQGILKDTFATKSKYAWSGLTCVYSSTRSSSFFFDDLSVRNGLPTFLGHKILNDSMLTLQFSGPLKKNLPGVNCFESLKNPVREIVIDGTYIHLTFSKSFTASNNLVVCPMEDLNGNKLPPIDLTFFYKKPVKRGDIVINEIFPDPTPTVGLPEAEFVEIHNTGSDTIRTGNLILTDLTTIGKLKDTLILPGEYAILCSSAYKEDFELYGKTIGVEPWPSLNNTSDFIILTDSAGLVVDSLFYSNSLFRTPSRKEGGWTLELGNTYPKCKSSWLESLDQKGGTPGKANSVHNPSDSEAPVILTTEIADKNTAVIVLKESVQDAPASALINEVSASLKIKGDSIKLSCNSCLTAGNLNTIKLNGVKDCKGNSINLFEEVLYEAALLPGELLISEILFNPRPYGIDFLELYNNSEKIINLKNFTIESIKEDSTLENYKINENIILPPYSYAALTEDPLKLQEQYAKADVRNIYKINNLPSFNDKSGDVKILKGEIIADSLTYSEDFHSPLLYSREGVSLERINFSLPSWHRLTWHSAAQPQGFATPGYENSQATHGNTSEKSIEINPQVFSPDLDGYEDFTVIRLKNIGTGFKGSIKIFDLKGRLIKILENNILLSDEYNFQWDGTTQEGERAGTGLYLICIKMFNARGETKEFKETVAVAWKF